MHIGSPSGKLNQTGLPPVGFGGYRMGFYANQSFPAEAAFFLRFLDFTLFFPAFSRFHSPASAPQDREKAEEGLEKAEEGLEKAHL